MYDGFFATGEPEFYAVLPLLGKTFCFQLRCFRTPCVRACYFLIRALSRLKMEFARSIQNGPSNVILNIYQINRFLSNRPIHCGAVQCAICRCLIYEIKLELPLKLLDHSTCIFHPSGNTLWCSFLLQSSIFFSPLALPKAWQRYIGTMPNTSLALTL
jgi:hypothetical protein